MSDPIEERLYLTTEELPDAVYPFSGIELAEVWQGGRKVKIPYSLLQGTPLPHKETHELNTDDQLGSNNPSPNIHVISDGTGKVDGWVSDASESVKGKVQLAADNEESAIKAMKADDPRGSDARAPLEHGSAHTSLGADPIPNASPTVAGLMSCADKLKLDSLSPGSGDLGSVLEAEATDLGVIYDDTDMFTHSKFCKSYGTEIGALVFLEHRKTPVTWSESKSSENPSYPEYFPAIPRYDGDHDITDAMAPLLVAELASKVITVGATTEFSGTLASGVITMPSTTDGTILLIALVNAALVLRWRDTNQSPTYESLGGLYTGTGQYCLRINGVNYGITNVNAVARTITIDSPPSNGSITFTIPQYGVPGSTTSIRLRTLSGFVPVACGDYDGEILEGLAKMDRIFRHRHAPLSPATSFFGTGGATPMLYSAITAASVLTTGDPVASNLGAIREGKTTDPRGFGTSIYTWARTLLAKDWT